MLILRSEPVVREGLVGLRHAMDFLALLHRSAAPFGRLLKLAGEPHGHRFLAALLRRLAQPAHRQRDPAYRSHLDRDLVVGAAHAPALYLDHRLLAARHQHVDELRHLDVGEFRIRQDLALGNFSATRHGLCGLRHLGAVLGAGLLAVLDALRVERAAHDVVAHPRQILDAPAADQHHRVLLQVVPLAADVADHLEAVGEAHLRDLAQRRVRLFRRGGIDARAHAALLRRAGERRHFRLAARRGAHAAHQLVDCGHVFRFQKRTGRPRSELRSRPGAVKKRPDYKELFCIASRLTRVPDARGYNRAASDMSTIDQYLSKPWLKHYQNGVPAFVEVPAKAVTQAFDEATGRAPDRPAVVFYGRRISYRELRDATDRLACALADLGVRKGDRVALYLVNSPQFIIAYFAALKCLRSARCTRATRCASSSRTAARAR